MCFQGNTVTSGGGRKESEALRVHSGGSSSACSVLPTICENAYVFQGILYTPAPSAESNCHTHLSAELGAAVTGLPPRGEARELWHDLNIRLSAANAGTCIMQASITE